MHHNRKNFMKSHYSKMHANSTCKLLLNDEIREKIINGTLDDNNCCNEDTKKFQNLMQEKRKKLRTKHNLLIEG